ncbi:MAG: transcriptional regulator, GntR family [Rhizobacter sp.]|nr:transcriptional regulator, GntR family [Rhizobacter sp.]
MAPPTRTNLSDRIRATLEAEIATGVLPVGSRIDEQGLMERFEVSRTPAREALLHLVSAGLVTSVPRQGAVVSGISLPEYIAMLEILMELEGLAARLCARRMPAAQRRELEAAAKACEDAARRDDLKAYQDVNSTFHEIIYVGSRNTVLAQQLRSMRARMRHPNNSLFDRPGRVRSSAAEHRAVVTAILAGDEEAADRAMTGHIGSGGNVYADSIASMSPVTTLAPTVEVAARAALNKAAGKGPAKEPGKRTPQRSATVTVEPREPAKRARNARAKV